MHRNLLFKFIFLLIVYLPIQAFTQSSDTSRETVYYFLDANCDNCSVKDYKNSKIWIVTTDIYTGSVNDQKELIKKFKTLISQQYQPDSTLLKQVVFRFQNSKEQIKETYAAIESKMKGRGYVILKIDF